MNIKLILCGVTWAVLSVLSGERFGIVTGHFSPLVLPASASCAPTPDEEKKDNQNGKETSSPQQSSRNVVF